jgi:hypothetical protein
MTDETSKQPAEADTEDKRLNVFAGKWNTGRVALGMHFARLARAGEWHEMDFS